MHPVANNPSPNSTQENQTQPIEPTLLIRNLNMSQEKPQMASTGMGGYLSANIAVGDGALGLTSQEVTGGQTGVSLELSSIAQETVLQMSMKNTFSANFTAFDRESTSYQTGVRIQMTDRGTALSVMSDISASASLKKNLQGVGRMIPTPYFGLKLDTYTSDVSMSVDAREIKLWDQGQSSNAKVVAVGLALSAGQSAGQLIGAGLGANLGAPALGASLGGYSAGFLTSKLISYLCPPNRVIKTQSPSAVNLDIPKLKFTGRTHFGGTRFLEASLNLGGRIASEPRLPQDIHLDNRSSETLQDSTEASPEVIPEFDELLSELALLDPMTEESDEDTEEQSTEPVSDFGIQSPATHLRRRR